MMSRSLACRDLVEIVTDYLEGALPRRQRARVERHLAECSGCSAYLDQMRETIRLTGRLRDEDIPRPVRDALVNGFLDWRTS